MREGEKTAGAYSQRRTHTHTMSLGFGIRAHKFLVQVAALGARNTELQAAAREAEGLQAELASARHSLQLAQSAVREGQLHQTQMVGAGPSQPLGLWVLSGA